MTSTRFLANLLALGAGAALALPANAQDSSDTVNAHMAAAGKAAGFDHIGIYNTTCARLGDPGAGRASPVPNDRDAGVWTAPPAKVFDNVYWLGEHAAQESHPSAWAIDTTEGIILIDALFNNSVQQQVIGGLQKMGLDPKRIKYLLVTHAHMDHYGGAKYIQNTYKARVLMSQQDWDFMKSSSTASPIKPADTVQQLAQALGHADVPPAYDMVVTDGQKLTLGDTTITMYVTPGHTPGTVSFLLPVTDHGQPHLAAMWGGTGWTFTAIDPPSKKMEIFGKYHDSAVRFRDIVTAAGADVVMGNHSYLDLAEQKNAVLAKRGPDDPNPWILGKEKTRDYMTVAAECSAAGVASFR